MSVLGRIGGWLGLQLKLAPQKPARGSLPFVGTSSDGRAVSAEWSTETAIQQGMKSSTWVFTACRKISTALASVPLVVEKLVGDQWEADRGHPLQALLDRPNPFMSRQDMHERWALHLLLGGNAFWHKVLVGGVPVEVWPLLPDQVLVIPSRMNFIFGYEWKQPGTEKQVLGADAVLHWQFADPSTPYRGLSPLQAAAQAVDTDLAAVRWNRATLANDGRPPLAIFLNDSLDASEQEIAARFIQGQIDGGAVRKALVLGGASKVQPLALNAAEMDWLQGRRFSREEIGAVFGVPPVLMVAGEGVTFANLDAAKRILWEDTIVPLLDDLCQGLGMGLLPHWDAQATHRIRADLSNVTALQENLKDRADTAKVFIDAGWPINAVNQRLALGFEPVEGGDVPRAPAAPMALPLPAAKSRAKPLVWQSKGAAEGQLAKRLARMEKWTAELTKQVATLLLQQGNMVASAYVKGGNWEAALSMDDWKSLLEAAYTAIMEAEGAVAFSTLLGSITTAGAGAGGTFDVLADGVQAFISDTVGDRIKYIDATSKAVLKSEIAAGVSAGESVPEISKRIKGLHEDWSGYRADRVARTETATAFSAAHQQSAQQLAEEFDLELVKTWVTQLDGREREEHNAMNGETVSIDKAFSNGLMQPGEPNCRCAVIYLPKGG